MTKEKFDIEYGLGNVSLNSLWNQLTTSMGLSSWFADKVAVKNNEYTFTWHTEEQKANAILILPEVCIRYRWINEPDPIAYFEFHIHTMELTGVTALEITDFAEPGEKEDAIDLWDSQVYILKRTLGI